MRNKYHKPVLLNEIINFIPKNCQLIIDGTLGHGGHSNYMLYKTEQLLGIDLDPQMLNKTKKRLGKQNIIYQQGSYSQIDKYLNNHKLHHPNYILIDLGVNMEHYKDPTRGFSINNDGILDMRFDKKQQISAQKIINKYKIDKLSQIFINYGDFTEKKSQQIAETITNQRKKNPINSTIELKNLLKTCGLGQKAISVIFQSIRIETNKEIINLKIFLDVFPKVLCIDGRCSIISYHSIEDRLVKNKFKELEKKGDFKLLNKKAIKPHYKEVQSNKASRSAILRVIEKIK